MKRILIYLLLISCKTSYSCEPCVKEQFLTFEQSVAKSDLIVIAKRNKRWFDFDKQPSFIDLDILEVPKGEIANKSFTGAL